MSERWMQILLSAALLGLSGSIVMQIWNYSMIMSLQAEYRGDVLQRAEIQRTIIANMARIGDKLGEILQDLGNVEGQLIILRETCFAQGDLEDCEPLDLGDGVLICPND